MSRNDSMLYSGLSSPIKKKTELAKAEETKLEPKGEAVLEELAKLKAELSTIEFLLLDDSMTEDARLRKIERIKAQFDVVKKLESRMKKVLGVK